MDGHKIIYPHIPIEPVFRQEINFTMEENFDAQIFTGEVDDNRQCFIDLLLKPKGLTMIGIPAKAIIDTGSFYTFTTKVFADMLDYAISEPCNAQPLGHASKRYNAGIVKAKIPLINNSQIPLHFLIEQNQDLFDGVWFVLGTNFLANFIFTYNEPKGKFTLQYLK